MTLVEQLVAIAQEIEVTDPIDWGLLAVDENTVYNVMASNVLENYLSGEPEERDMLLLATTVKLIVENFVLNLKLSQRNVEFFNQK